MDKNPHVIVIGGGFAGLRAAVGLADAGLRVTVLEGRIRLGGRARSFIDPATGQVVDNGQHLFLSGYRETISFLERLGTADRLVFQPRLEVLFAEPGGGRTRLRCPPLPAPWHLIAGAARLSGIPLKDRFQLRRVARAAASFDPRDDAAANELDALTADEWLARAGQSQRMRTLFWDPLVLATLNEEPSRASALGLATVLRTLLFAPARDSRLGMSATGLTELYADAAKRAIEEKGGQVLVNRPVAALVLEGRRLSGVRLADGSVLAADAFVSGLPPAALAQIVPPDPALASDPALSGLGRFTTSPIISINLWFDEPLTRALFVGFVGTRIHWLFNKEAILAKAGIEADYVTLIVSAAHALIDRPKEEIVALALEELRACLPAARNASLIRSQVVREKEATVSLSAGSNRYRPGPVTSVPNLFLAGDWTATRLPATIESAVLSGRLCAEAVLSSMGSDVKADSERACLTSGARVQ